MLRNYGLNFWQNVIKFVPCIVNYIIIFIIITYLTELGSHPVAVVQYTYTHTNSAENDTKQTIHTTTQKLGRVRAVPPSLRVLPWHFALQLRKKHGKTSVRVAIHKHT